MGAVQILGVIVLIIGILLIGVEFYMPGFGFPGIAGIIFTAAGIFLTGSSIQERVIVGVIAIVIVAVMLVISIVIFS
jgi:membrane-bound ClpP family serine protease